jgi:hypothetical protein
MRLRKISWREFAYRGPEREAKRIEKEQAFLLSMVDVRPAGQMKYCWAIPRFDVADG